MEEKVKFKNSRNLDISGILSTQEKKSNAVILSHGFLSFKENKLLYKIAKALEAEGFATLRFDFSGCIGQSGGTCNDMMLSHQIDDLASSVNFLSKHPKISKMGLVGHSLGGLTSIIVGTQDPRISSLVSIAAPANLGVQKLISDEFAMIWKHDRQAKFKTLKGEVGIDFTFYKDMKEYSGEEIIKRLKAPIRLIHGTEDNIVLMESSELLLKNAGGKKDLQRVEGGDHLFLSKELSTKVSSLTAGWMKKTLVD